MRTHRILLLIAAVALGQPGSHAQSPPTSQPAGRAEIQRQIELLGAPTFSEREAAMQALIGLGGDWVSELQVAHDASRDAEVRVRLRFVLDNVSPPTEAVLALRDSQDGQLKAGDLVTHLDGRRVRDSASFQLRMEENDSGAILRVRRDGAPREIGPVETRGMPRLVDYRLPHGPMIQRALTLYRDGYAERAWELLSPLVDVSEKELPNGLRAIIAYTAGDVAAARSYFVPELMTPPDGRVQWTNLSGLDRMGPLRAPLEFEIWWFANGGPQSDEPDMLIQRVMIPARQYVPALRDAASLWWTKYRHQLENDTHDDRVAGNMIAIVAWMLSSLNLPSECIQLIEPRSALLGAKWVRVQSDAWPQLLAGDPAAALNRFWDDARIILDDRAIGPDRQMLTRNPDVAATVGLFLYMAPEDPRASQMLDLVEQPDFAAREEFLRWMLFALNSRNEDRIRRDLSRLLPKLDGSDADNVAFALALLAYVSPTEDAELFASARERVALSTDSAFRASHLPQVDALRALRAGRADEASALLSAAPAGPGRDVLRSTAEFLRQPPVSLERHPELGNALAAVSIAAGSAPRWIVLTRDRRWLQVDPGASAVTPLQPPTADWFPGAINWPWIGRAKDGERVWTYDRRRLIEVGRDPSRALRLNLEPEQIGDFDRNVSAVFNDVADAIASTPIPAGERGEFLRAEVQAYPDYVADPDLHDLAVVESIEHADGLLHVAVRGGPQLMVDVARSRVWSSGWVAQKAGLERAPVFFPVAAPGVSPPRIFLMSDQGLLRFDASAETVTLVPLPEAPVAGAVVPESCPYARRDERFLYCARPPADGGAVYRLNLADGAFEKLDMKNHVLPAIYYTLRTRDGLRRSLDAILAEALGVPSLRTFIQDTRETVAKRRPGAGAAP